jgi:hypothetical protein
MRHFRPAALFLLLLSSLVLTLSAAQAQTNTPQHLLLAYYTNINLQNYEAAYAMWVSPPQSYEDFAEGFDETDHVTPYFGALQPSSVAGEFGHIPVVLLGYTFRGEVASYFGCFTLSSDFRIAGATIHEISSNGIPDGASITNYLAIDCTNIPASLPTTFLDTTDTNYGLIWSYFRAINQKDFQTAYNSWLSPIAGEQPNGQPTEDYRQTFESFSGGYGNTVWIDVYPGIYNATGASAGHSYLNGLMPLVLVGQQTEGSVDAYYGCFVMGTFPNGLPGIVSGQFYPLLNNLPTGDQIVEAQNIDCTTLNLQY